jgi:hypothetical protein
VISFISQWFGFTSQRYSMVLAVTCILVFCRGLEAFDQLVCFTTYLAERKLAVAGSRTVTTKSGRMSMPPGKLLGVCSCAFILLPTLA